MVVLVTSPICTVRPGNLAIKFGSGAPPRILMRPNAIIRLLGCKKIGAKPVRGLRGVSGIIALTGVKTSGWTRPLLPTCSGVEGHATKLVSKWWKGAE